jgi:hypothetical protein
VLEGLVALLAVASIITVIQRFAYVYRAANGVDAAAGLSEPVRSRPRERAATLDPLAKGR